MLRINAIVSPDCCSKGNACPIFPPNYYRHSNYLETERFLSSSYYNFLSQTTENKNNRKKNVKGAIYRYPYIEGYHKINIDKYVHCDILLRQDNKAINGILIRVVDEKILFDNVRGLGNCLQRSKHAGNARAKEGNYGKMYALGYRDVRNKLLYQSTMDDEVAIWMQRISRSVHPLCANFFPQQYVDLTNPLRDNEIAANYLDVMGGRTYFMGHNMFFTIDYSNSSHLDIGDASMTIAIWVEELPGKAKNWDFIFPDLSINNSNGVVIPLKNGLMMTWDGSIVRHCSAVSSTGDKNHVYGLAFVCKKKMIRK